MKNSNLIFSLLAALLCVSCQSVETSRASQPKGVPGVDNPYDPDIEPEIAKAPTLKVNHLGGTGMVMVNADGSQMVFWDGQRSLKDLMDFGGTLAGAGFGYLGLKQNQITRRVVSGHNLQQALGAQDVTKRLATESASVVRGANALNGAHGPFAQIPKRMPTFGSGKR